jgi:histidinol-phosphate/aromatic aminotransferase/cobyric acid decarboxylase-like protein/choline kinase
MIAIILAAGYGNRMRPLTDNEHKTLLKINGITIIDNIIESLLANSVYNIVVVTGYRSDELKKYLLDNYKNVNFQFVNNKDYKTTNNISSLSLAFKNININSDIILIESDLIYDHKIIRNLIDDSNKNVALVAKYNSGMDGTVVKIGSKNKITEVIPPHLQDSNFSFTDKYKTLNIYKFSGEFTNSIFSKLLNYYSEVIDDNCYYELVLGILIYMQKEDIYSLVVDNKDWIEVDDTNDIRIAEYKFAKNQKKEVLGNAWGGYWNYDIIDFSFIRNMYFPTPSMIADVKNNIEELIWNYGSSNKIFNQKLSYYLLKDENKLCALNGAAQIYPFIKNKYSDMNVLIPNPTFGEYEKIFNKKQYYKDDGRFNFSEISEKIDDNDIIVFVNPNNPTGTFVESYKIYELIKKYPNKFFIIDESFIDFSNSISISEIPQAITLNNFLIVKSMSKSHGFPGVRLGYVYSNNLDLINEINASLPVWNYNSFAEYFLEIMLKYRNQFKISIDKTIEDRNEFIKNMKSQNWVKNVFESSADFILVETNKEVVNLINILLDEDSIYIRDISSKFNNGKTYFRFAVRTFKENKLMIEAISRNFEKLYNV